MDPRGVEAGASGEGGGTIVLIACRKSGAAKLEDKACQSDATIPVITKSDGKTHSGFSLRI